MPPVRSAAAVVTAAPVVDDVPKVRSKHVPVIVGHCALVSLPVEWLLDRHERFSKLGRRRDV